MLIDDAFIEEWDPKYRERDEGDYGEVMAIVAKDLEVSRTISKRTFLRIWNWKGAMRVIRHVRLDQYDSRYAAAFRRAASAPPERKLYILIDPTAKLPGIGAPTGSTILHFMHPETMPIIDVRTVGVLFKAGLISTNSRDLGHYEEFRKAIERIKKRCPSRSLRQIDRALFACHKDVLDKTPRGSRCSSPSASH
jgi:hypothetical protein